jgi:hypothetical protein
MDEQVLFFEVQGDWRDKNQLAQEHTGAGVEVNRRGFPFRALVLLKSERERFSTKREEYTKSNYWFTEGPGSRADLWPATAHRCRRNRQ